MWHRYMYNWDQWRSHVAGVPGISRRTGTLTLWPRSNPRACRDPGAFTQQGVWLPACQRLLEWEVWSSAIITRTSLKVNANIYMLTECTALLCQCLVTLALNAITRPWHELQYVIPSSTISVTVTTYCVYGHEHLLHSRAHERLLRLLRSRASSKDSSIGVTHFQF